MNGTGVDPQVGLCAACAHCRRLTSARSSTFYLCRRAEEDPAYRRYPSLPVLRCPGYEAQTSDG
jgi:hypothetical protein